MKTNAIITCRLQMLFFGMLLAACVPLLQERTCGQPIDGAPVKLAIQAQTQSVYQGEPMTVRCVLLDANNNQAKAPKDLVANIETILPSGKSSRMPVTIKAGESSAVFIVPTTKTGITELRVRQKELMDGGTFIKIKPAKSTASVFTNSTPILPQEKSIHNESRPQKQPGLLPPDNRVAILESKAGVPAPATSERSLDMMASPTSPTLSTNMEGTYQSTEKPGIILQYQIRKYWADGKDAATIWAFLDGGVNETASDIQITLFSDTGKMRPMPLAIHKGEDSAQTTLTTDQTGTTTVKYVKSNPEVLLRDGREMKFTFEPPITELGLQASPPKISLLEKGEIIVKLLGEKKTLVATDEPKKISFAIENGNGHLEPAEISVDSKSASAHSIFTPTRPGLVRISASTPNLMASAVDITVTIPVMLISCSMLGAILGGAVASVSSQTRRKHKMGWGIRVFIGFVAGFTFYYFGILGLILHITPAIALNPVGALVLSIIGGWLGIEVFDLVLKYFGINIERKP